MTFFRDVLGVPQVEVAPGFAWSKPDDSSQLEIFGPPDTDHLHFTTRPVPEFLVDDLQTAVDELHAAFEILGPAQGPPDQSWLHRCAPALVAAAAGSYCVVPAGRPSSARVR